MIFTSLKNCCNSPAITPPSFESLSRNLLGSPYPAVFTDKSQGADWNEEKAGQFLSGNEFASAAEMW
jgi:hypothetical protein